MINYTVGSFSGPYLQPSCLGVLQNAPTAQFTIGFTVKWRAVIRHDHQGAWWVVPLVDLCPRTLCCC